MKNKICFCIDSLNIGGAERLVVDLINHWSSDWDIYLVTFFDDNILSPTLNQNKTVTHVTLGANCSRLAAITMMFKFCLTHKIDVALCHLERSNKWLAIGSRLAGAKVFNTVHSINIYNETSKLKKYSISILYNLIPHRIIAISDTVGEYLISLKINHKKITIIQNGVDVNLLNKRYRLDRPQKQLALAVLSRLEPVKALDILLNTLALFNSVESNWSLRIIGDGSQRIVLEKQAYDLGISEKIEFVGAQVEPLLYLQDRTALCMASYREGLPIALLESLSMGLPAIVSNVGFLPRLISDNQNGFICEPGSTKSLLSGIKKFNELTHEKWASFSAEALKVALQYDIQQCSSQYQAVVNDLL